MKYIHEYNTYIKKYLLLREKSILAKIFVLFIYICMLPIFIMFLQISIWAAIAAVLIVAIFYYIGIFVIYTAFKLPDRVLFKSTNELCDSIDKLFKNSFYEYKIKKDDKSILNVTDLINVDNIPDKTVLSIWKYKLATKKDKIQMILPMLGLMIFSIFRSQAIAEPLAIVKQYLDNYDIVKEALQFFKQIYELSLYPYLIASYYSNIERINGSIYKVELICEITEE